MLDTSRLLVTELAIAKDIGEDRSSGAIDAIFAPPLPRDGAPGRRFEIRTIGALRSAKPRSLC